VEADKLNKERKRIVVITRGENTTLVAEKGEEFKELTPCEIAKEDILDTNGAGDCINIVN
jgi:sugar/nucleoside kinase (ribokinase family)